MRDFENNCFSRGGNCEPICFSCNLSLSISTLALFFGQDHRYPKSECARRSVPTGSYIRYRPLEICLTGELAHGKLQHQHRYARQDQANQVRNKLRKSIYKYQHKF